MEMHKVKRVEFGLLDPNEIVSLSSNFQQCMSVAEIYYERIYQDNQMPVEHGINDL